MLTDWEKAQAARRLKDGLPEGLVLLEPVSVDESVQGVLGDKQRLREVLG